MKCWILVRDWGYEGFDILNVFLSKDKAINEKNRLEKDDPLILGIYDIDEYEVTE